MGRSIDISTVPLSEFDSLFDAKVNQSHIQEWEDGFVIYQPVAYRDEHGTVLAHLITKTEDGIDLSKYYSRGWGYWNFVDHTIEASHDEFDFADDVMAGEFYYFGDVDRHIDIQDAIDVIKAGKTPDKNPEFQRLVVAMAYNAITEDSEFIRVVREAGLKPFDVQLMIDRAMIRILGNRNFRLEDSVLI